MPVEASTRAGVDYPDAAARGPADQPREGILMKQEEIHRYAQPPEPSNAQGNLRRVGFELEFSSITLDDATSAIGEALGGRVKSETAAKTVFEVDDLGEFGVELDWDYLKRKAVAEDPDFSESGWLEFMSQAAALLVPVEVVCPPIPLDRLDRLDPMVDALRRAGAVGTEESLLAAYGVHINTEIPRLDSATLHRYLRAYVLLQWWLVDAHEVDPTRRLSPYIDLYPEAYLHRVLTCDTPDMTQIMDDYLEHNATRNRALDLLPLLKEIDSARIERDIDDPRVNARPAFHYRLPNCQIDHSDWSLSHSWNTWLVVERLAVRDDDLRQLATEFEAAQRPLLGVDRADWVERINAWLIDRGLA